jgi:tetratricopeptide (TPR) repeat protein
MRSLNVNAAVILLVVVIVLAGGTALLHSYQITRHSSTFYDMAKAAWNNKPRREADAFQSMKDYLALKPTDFKARQELGDWLVESGHFKSASDVLEELIRTLEKQDTPDTKLINEVHRKLVDIFIDHFHDNQAALQAAESHLKALLEAYPPDHPEKMDGEGATLYMRLGDCQRKQHKDDEAIDSYKFALSNDANKDRVDIWLDLAMTYQYGLVKKMTEAQKCMADMIAVKQNAESPFAHLAYGMWLDEQLGKYQDALQQAEIALKLKPDLVGALYLAGRCALNLRDLPKAEEYATRGLKADPQDPPLYKLLADIYLRDERLGKAKGNEKAVKILKQGVDAVKTNEAKVELLWSLANLDLDGRGGATNAESIAAAKECMRLMGDNVSREQRDFLDARVAYANSEWEAARVKFEKVRPLLTDLPPQLCCLEYWIGYCCLQQGNPDQAMVAFRRSLGYDKYYFRSRDQIAQIFMSKGEYQNALEEYRQALVGNPLDDEAWVAYARAVLLLTLNTKEEERKWSECLADLKTASQHTKSGQIAMFFVEAYLAMGNPKAAKEAEKLLEAMHKDSPKSAAIWVSLANIEARHNNMDKAVAILDEARAKLGDDFLIRLARASYACREKGEQAGPDIEAQAANIDHYTNEEKTQLLNGLFNNLMDINDFDRAKEFGRRIAKLQPHDATFRHRLLELDLATHNYRDPAASLADIDRLLDEIEAIAGRGPIWLYGKAVRLRLEAARGKPELLNQAMEYAQNAKEKRVNWSRPYVLMGEICRAQGKDDEALQHYLEASANGDLDLNFNRLLLQMLKDRQLFQEAQQVIQRLQRNQAAGSPELARSIVEIVVRNGSLDDALKIANKGYDSESDDYRDHLWHGQMLRILAARARADARTPQAVAIVAAGERALRKAIEIAPSAAECRVELVLLLAADNQTDKARRVTAEAEVVLPDKVAPVALACMYEAIGEHDKARTRYEKALELQPNQPLLLRTLAAFYIHNQQSELATPLVDKLLSGEIDVTEADRLIARRMKARLLIAGGQFAKLKQAMALIEQNLKSPSSTREDLSIKAQILAADPATSRDAETLKLMLSLVQAGGAEPRPSDLYALACLYYRSNKWPDCRVLMEKLISPDQCDPNYLAAYVKMLLEQEQLVDAAMQLGRLEKVSKPGAAVPLRAELMFRRKTWHEVKDFLLAFLDQPNAVPQDRQQRALLVAGLFEDFGKRLTAPPERAVAQGFFDEAGKLMEANAKADAAGQMALASFYARRGRPADSIKLLQQFASKTDSVQLGVAAISVMKSEKITREQQQQLEELLTAASTARKQPVILLAALGALKITQGQPDKAEAIYRQLLTVDPNNIIALNNLAVLLALTNKDTDEALRLIEHAIQLAGSQPGLIDSRAVVRIMRGEPQKALEDLDLILNDTSDKIDPIWLFHKAWALDAGSSPDDARDVMATLRKEPYNIDRSMIDPPERAEFDKLLENLKNQGN